MLGPSLMNQNEFSLEVTNAVIARILFMYIGTLCDASKRIFFLSIVCSDCKNTVFYMLEPSLMNQNKFSLEVTNAVIARILFMYIETLCDASKRIFFLSILCSDCKNTFFCMLEPSLMNQNKISLEVTNALIARILSCVCCIIM